MTGRSDAEGMRHAAAQLRGKADRIAMVLARLDRQVASMTYAGPAADEFRGVMAAQRVQLRETTRILCETADILSRSAVRAETDPRLGGAPS
jgi:uncharacterized protein YukE